MAVFRYTEGRRVPKRAKSVTKPDQDHHHDHHDHDRVPDDHDDLATSPKPQFSKKPRMSVPPPKMAQLFSFTVPEDDDDDDDHRLVDEDDSDFLEYSDDDDRDDDPAESVGSSVDDDGDDKCEYVHDLLDFYDMDDVMGGHNYDYEIKLDVSGDVDEAARICLTRGLVIKPTRSANGA